MKLEITVEISNATFIDNQEKLKEILIKIAEKVRHQETGIVNDSNGNKVAKFTIQE